jgi:hypothetical protein
VDATRFSIHAISLNVVILLINQTFQLMKTSNRLFQVLVIALFFSISITFAQQTHYVTIHVDTDQITSQNELEVCYFTSESPDLDVITSEGNIEEFNISVNAGDTIIWKGVSSSNPETDVVNVTSINYHGGDNVFDSNVLNGNNETPEEVVGVVKTGTNGQVEKYTIKFTVLNNGNRRGGTFQIDPKITVKI